MSSTLGVNLDIADPARIGRDVERAALKQQAERLLSKDAEVDRKLARRGLTPGEADVIRQAGRAGLLNGLVKIEIVDPYSNAKRIEFLGDDQGATWQQFANPLKIGRLATPTKEQIASATATRRGWWQP
jgi:hypothetical protein